MKKTVLTKVLGAAVLGAALMVSTAASAAVAYLTSPTSLRAGPGGDFPRLDRLPPNARVELLGCVDRFDWCDVRFGRMRGWVDGDNLFVPWQGRRVRVMEYGPRLSLPVISFRFDNYWDEHYRGRPFYRERERFRAFADRDHDGIPNRFDRTPNGRPQNGGPPGRRDEDHDGIPNRVDRDRDGDGVPNRLDSRPDNRRRD
jgi:uncharacterized protein YraI